MSCSLLSLFGFYVFCVQQVLAGRFLGVIEICALSATCRFFRDLFATSSVWIKIVERHCAPFSLNGLSRVDWKDIISAVYPRLDLIRSHVALQHVSRLAALPPSNPEAVSFFLYIYWSGEKIGSPRMLKIDPEHLVHVDLASGKVWMHTGTVTDLPLVCHGWSGVNSLIELVMVNRRVSGNRKVLASFSSFGRCMRREDRNVNVGSTSANGV